MMNSAQDNSKPHKITYIPALMAGAIAGFSVDVTMYPLDTLKTRLQSEQGFQKAGGFRGVYRGLLTVATSSMPTTALFFASYESTKQLIQPRAPAQCAPLVNMLAASVGEVLACVIRVPTEIAKQRKQTYVGSNMRSSIRILAEAYRKEGLRKGLYRGFLSTVARDLPFSFIELPVWELLKDAVRVHNDGEVTGFQSAVCGSLAGGLAAALTTPLDLAKTRIMLAAPASRTAPASPAAPAARIRPVLAHIYADAGIRGLFAGVTPRMMTFMFGGFVFFGVYDDSKRIIQQYLEGR